MKEIRKLLSVIALVGVVSTPATAQTSTTTVNVNGNTTTTTTITNTPVSTTVVPNTPNIGDLTTTTINQTTTDVMTKVANTNSGNLVSTNFCDNSWTGTQKTNSPSGSTSDLGCNYITGKGTSSYLESEKNLLSVGISKVEQNLGFTQSASAYTYHYWSWNSYLNFSHSVINNDTGGTITQNRIWNQNNYFPASTKSLDTIIIGENSATGFTSKMRFDLSSSKGGGTTWQGVDIRDPKLSITYNKLTSTSSSLQTTATEIIPCATLGTCYTPPIIQKIEEPKILSTSGQTIDQQLTTNTTASEPTPIIQNTSITNSISTKTETLSSPKTNTYEANNTTAMTTETPKESNATKTSSTQETASTSTKTESTTENKSSTTTQSTSSENSKTEGSSPKTSDEKSVSTKENTTDTKGSSIDVKVKAAVEKVERELKSIGDKTKAIQEIKIDGMKAGAPNLGAYENRAFYEPKYYNGVPNPDFYLQADIAQKPVYANVSLVAYTSKDPIGKQQAAMQEIQDEMNDIIIQLEQLKRK